MLSLIILAVWRWLSHSFSFSWNLLPQIDKSSVGFDGAHYLLVNIENDGFFELLWLQKQGSNEQKKMWVKKHLLLTPDPEALCKLPL